MKYLIATIPLFAASTAFAGSTITANVPELSAVGATAAIAGVAAGLALVRERTRRNRKD